MNSSEGETEIKPILQRCLNICDVNAHKKTEFKRPPLIIAVYLNRLKLVKELLKRGARIDIIDGYGNTPTQTGLHEEIWKDLEVQELILKYQLENYKLLQKQTEIDPKLKDKYKHLFVGSDLGLM